MAGRVARPFCFACCCALYPRSPQSQREWGGFALQHRMHGIVTNQRALPVLAFVSGSWACDQGQRNLALRSAARPPEPRFQEAIMAYSHLLLGAGEAPAE